jgi:ABC-type multidrug transport system ATPase subunit
VLADVAAEAVVLLSTHIVEDIESLCSRLAIMADGRIVAEGSPADMIADLDGCLWSRVVPRGEQPPQAVHLSAVPRGTLAVVHEKASPGTGYAPHAPRLEDAYHVALAAAGAGEAVL